MSYDLNFYKRKTDSTSKKDIEDYLNELPNVTKEIGKQWFYQNEETGVYCSFEYYENDEKIELENFEEFEDTNLAFNINFIRPQFFGKECFTLVDKFVEQLNLFILNPQGDGEPKKYKKGELEEEWAESNLRFSKANFEEFGLSYLDLEKSNYSWEFCFNRNEFQDKLGENYLVPGIFYVKKKGSDDVATLSVWPEHIPFVLPKVDYILVQKKIKKLFKTKKEDGLIGYDDLILQIGQFFEEKGKYKIIHPENSIKISKIFNNLKLIGSLKDFGEGVTIDKIVNVKKA